MKSFAAHVVNRFSIVLKKLRRLTLAESPIMGTKPTKAELDEAKKVLQYEKIRLWSEMLYDKHLKPTHVRSGQALTDLMTLDNSLYNFFQEKKIGAAHYRYISKKLMSVWML